MSKYDIIIIGSGLGGLECGAILSKEGFNVCVVEKNAQFGGCFQTYQRKGHLLDTGIHYVGSLDEGQVMNQYFRYFGIMDKLKIKRLDDAAFDTIYYKGKTYDYAMGYPQFIETITPDPALRNVLAGSALLYGGLKDVSTFYQHAMINHSYIEGAYRFVDGSMQVSLELINVIRANGGTVLNNSEVTRIIVENEKVQGVIINGEERLESDFVISNMHPQRTLEILDKNRSIKNAYISRIRSLENTYGIFTLYLIMKKRSTPYQNRNLYLHANNKVWYDKLLYPGRTTNCMISMQASSEDSQYASVISILTPMYIDELSAWKDTTPEHRGEDYQSFKKEKAKQILRFIRGHGIDLSENIEEMYATTPLSYRDYTGTVDGSAYGIIKDYKCPQIGFVSTRSRLGNLFLTGQNLNVHGALGVTLTAMLTCAEFVGQEYLAKKVGNA